MKPMYNSYSMIIPLPHSHLLLLFCATPMAKRTVWMTLVQRKQFQFSFPILELYQAREIFYKNKIAAGNRPPNVVQVNIF